MYATNKRVTKIKTVHLTGEGMKINAKLQHYKGGNYTVIGQGTHSETLENMLIYQNDADRKVWIRPLKMFYEEVEWNGEWVPRFKEIK